MLAFFIAVCMATGRLERPRSMGLGRCGEYGGLPVFAFYHVVLAVKTLRCSQQSRSSTRRVSLRFSLESCAAT